jgi:hypothetical protein
MIKFTSQKSLDVLSKDLEAAVAANNFSVLAVHDLRAGEGCSVPAGMPHLRSL